ncbi:MAG: transcription termination/antitermination protein NusG [Candidatus Cloacimonadota bacterium]|nr:transcription termination/antitermination protein NusG [Candidatus Cloacimonadota bacterium]
MVEEPKWYVVHTYSGHENKVKTSLELLVKNSQMEDLIVEVAVPTEEVVKTSRGKKKVVERKIFPGYVLVKMIVTNDSWYVVRNVKGVLGFVGPDAKPVPITADEVYSMGLEDKVRKVNIDLEVGESVTVIEGPFENFNGVIEQVNEDKETVTVLVSMFGRETPVELDFHQVEK